MPANSRIKQDIFAHYVERIHKLVEDTADTCERMDLPIYKDVALSLISGLVGEACLGARAARLKEAVFLEFCTEIYRAVDKALARKGR